MNQQIVFASIRAIPTQEKFSSKHTYRTFNCNLCQYRKHTSNLLDAIPIVPKLYHFLLISFHKTKRIEQPSFPSSWFCIQMYPIVLNGNFSRLEIFQGFQRVETTWRYFCYQNLEVKDKRIEDLRQMWDCDFLRF